MDDTTIKIMTPRACPGCHTHGEFTVTKEGVRKFNSGDLIQNCFPELSSADRERFVTGYCGTCWDNLFANDGEE
jgi:hypothetical protein